MSYSETTICDHSRRLSDSELSLVFHLGGSPFDEPSGGHGRRLRVESISMSRRISYGVLNVAQWTVRNVNMRALRQSIVGGVDVGEQR